MRIVDDPVEDGVGDGGFSDHLMPSRDRKLGGDDCGSALVALFEEFEQIKALLIGEGMGAPVVEHQELDAGEFVDETGESTIEPGHAHILEHTQFKTTQRYAHLFDTPLRDGLNKVAEIVAPRFRVVGKDEGNRIG